MDRKAAYLRKLGVIVDSVSRLPPSVEDLNPLEREGVLHLVQVAIDATMDVAAMLVTDRDHQVRDDNHNLQALEELGVLDGDLAASLRTLNGLRNAIVHRYNKFEEAEVFDNLDELRTCLVSFTRAVDAAEKTPGGKA